MKAREQPSREEAKVTCTHFLSINFDSTNSLCRGFVPGIKRTATSCCQLKSMGRDGWSKSSWNPFPWHWRVRRCAVGKQNLMDLSSETILGRCWLPWQQQGFWCSALCGHSVGNPMTGTGAWRAGGPSSPAQSNLNWTKPPAISSTFALSRTLN